MNALFSTPLLCLGLAPSAFAAGQTTFSLLADRVPDAIQNSQLTSHADPGQVVHISVNFNPPNLAALQAFADSASNPVSPAYKRFLTPAEIGVQFGQPASVISGVVSYLKSQGFTIKLVTADRLHILADGAVRQAESAFKTRINLYHSNSSKPSVRSDFFSYAQPLQLPASFAPLVQHVGGLQNWSQPAHRTTITPNQARVLYNTNPEFQKGMYGQGRTVAISSWGGFRLSNDPLYYAQFNLPVPPGGVNSNVTVETIDGGLGSSTPNVEADLDIQMVLGQAPDCNFLIYDGNPGAVGEPTDVLVTEANDDKADIISESYGWDLDTATAAACHTAHVEMTAEGITYMEAAGDSGTELEPFSYPDYEPEVLQVGGSAAQVDSQGNRQSEVAWDFGGGGWVVNNSSFNTLPSWQKGPGVPKNINYRLVPDIAAHSSGDQHFTYNAVYFFFDGQLQTVSGTSDASPMMAGDLAVAEQKVISGGGLTPDKNGHRRFGRISDLFYKENERPDIWYDITVGDTGVLLNGQEATATTGWDFCSGLGCINWDAFVKAVAIPPVVVTPYNAAIYDDPVQGLEGTGATGSYRNLAAQDNSYFSIESVTNTSGQIAAGFIQWSLNVAPSQISDLTLTLVSNASPQVTQYVYLYNFTTGNWDVVYTGASTGVDGSVTLDGIKAANYVYGPNNLIYIVDRGVKPGRFGSTPFRLNIDQAIMTESY